MNKFLFYLLCTTTLFVSCSTDSAKNQKEYIQHTVMFNLKHEPNSKEERIFLENGERILSALPMVINFEVKRQISKKTDFDFYFTMYFEDQASYEAYNNHPEHISFVSERWETEVSSFQEADFIIYP